MEVSPIKMMRQAELRKKKLSAGFGLSLSTKSEVNDILTNTLNDLSLNRQIVL